MYLVKVNNVYVRNMIMFNENKYDVYFSTNKLLAKEIGIDEVKRLKKDFTEAKVIKIETKEVDVTNMIMMSL